MTKRRGNGEGTIDQRRDGTWRARLTLPNGKRQCLYAKTRHQVAEKLNTALEARKKGLAVVNDRTTLGEYLAQWLVGAKPSLRLRTWARYESCVRVHVSPAIGRVALSRLQPHHLQELYSDLLTKGLAPRSVRNVHVVIRRALGQAERWGFIPRNAAALVDKPRAERPEITTLTEDQVRALLVAAAGTRFEALYVLAITTGMRQGELLGLHWRDIDLDRGALQVRWTLTPAKGGFHFAEPKTTRSRRRVELGPTAIASLRRHRVAQNAERMALAGGWIDNDLVFANEIGNPVDATNLTQRSFRRLLAAAGLRRIRFHDLRHTAATLMLGRGVHPKLVSEMLGHSQVAITLDLYSHVTPTMHREAAAVMDRIVAGGAS